MQPPSDLGEAGLELWNRITDGFEFRPDEITIITSVCRMQDTIGEYESVLEGEPMTVKGSQGQQVIHPIRGELRSLRMNQAQLLGRLKFPDDEQEEMTTSEKARKAARARWSKHA